MDNLPRYGISSATSPTVLDEASWDQNVTSVKTASGEEPVIIGKPYPAMFEMALQGLDRNRAVMIGDNPATDILGARQFGIATILVSDQKTQLYSEQVFKAPNRIISNLSALFDEELTSKQTPYS